MTQPTSASPLFASALLDALHFAATQHSAQRRKDKAASPYINHPIRVAQLLVSEGGVTDLVTLQAAILHDTVEDTGTTPEELERRFGPAVRRVVEEVTDDKRLPKGDRKRLQVEHAPHLSPQAKQLKIADKTANVQNITTSPPDGWSLERKREYLDWADQVVAGCRGCNPALEAVYDKIMAEGRRSLQT
ncbi:MAG: bifunctional (p)ppGpp synthetase/guanosine-3',5'-bis(diphosphate) 3'-pyrophosphohydrolase [Leptolyngbya sp. DLM2.Bin27]|nr:MAG: bifunctional (p)ppGpp synthetase/guanosine-3',5'-bis(diphosphate) 3'-pyrophosphohydrolase [Leptolyngbya sp. DLM2.Bin27]